MTKSVLPEKVSLPHLLTGMATYFLWGIFPLYFIHLEPAGAFEVIVHRAVWGMLFCLGTILIMRRWGNFKLLLRDRKSMFSLALGGFVVALNWTTYVYAVMNDHTVDAALGYFINPLITVALAMIVLRERITVLQGIALGLGVLAVVVLVVGMGRLPWVSLVLAVSFGVYSLVKKNVSTQVNPLEGMAVETAAVTPVLLGYFAYLAWHSQTSVQRLVADGQPVVLHLVLLVCSGVITMIPLIMFAKSAQGLPLGVMGLIQYIGPVIQLIVGVYIFGEPMEPARWAGTAIVWVALIFLTIDMLRTAYKVRKHDHHEE